MLWFALPESSAIEESRVNPVDKREAATASNRRQWLESHLNSRIALTWTDNRTSMISVTRRPSAGYQLRLHHMFQIAPEPIWQALGLESAAAWITASGL